MKTDYTKYIRKLSYEYNIKIQQKVVDGPQVFFKNVKMKRKQMNDIPNVMYLNNQRTEKSEDIADLFRQFLSRYILPHKWITEENSMTFIRTIITCKNYQIRV